MTIHEDGQYGDTGHVIMRLKIQGINDKDPP